jgi:DNA-binding transcriptional MerR regulator
MNLLTVADASRILGVVPDTVRYLERVGKLQAQRTSSGWRLFDRRDVERLRRQREQAAASKG